MAASPQSSIELLTAAQLRQLLVTILAGATGKPKAGWEAALGTIEHQPMTVSPRTNWTLRSKPGAHSEAVAHAVRIVRAEHPYIAR